MLCISMGHPVQNPYGGFLLRGREISGLLETGDGGGS
ncbi:hypothetical protein FHX41_6044 [Actinomadura hallensis]|uniref:Uncharacterized protein n=1 Tax=Actinomadura hallensis TaxID=337895 RepID=A0A543INX0_9ACTN|nr:hypothetical protein FHX41_6044 [Actinomadura hallensis]